MRAPDTTTAPSRRVSTRAVALGILVVALLLAGGVSFYAASTPDGLTKVAEEKGFDSSARAHASDESPLAGYDAGFISNDRLGGGVAGIAGVLVVLALGTALTLVVRRRGPRSAPDRTPASEPSDA